MLVVRRFVALSALLAPTLAPAWGGSRGDAIREARPELTVTLYDLLLAFREVGKRAELRPEMEVSRDEFSIEQMMAYLFEKIAAARGTVSLTDVLPNISSRRGLITAFLALLELTRLHAIYLRQ